MIKHGVQSATGLVSILPDDGENWDAMSQRSLRCVASWLDRHPDDHLLFVCHDAVMQGMANALCGSYFKNQHGMPFRYAPEADGWRVERGWLKRRARNLLAGATRKLPLKAPGPTIPEAKGADIKRTAELEAIRRKLISLTAYRQLLNGPEHVSDWLAVDQAMIDMFADATHDHQFIHTDRQRAESETPYGGTIAHGFLTLSLLSALAFDAMPGVEGTRMGVNYGFERGSLPQPGEIRGPDKRQVSPGWIDRTRSVYPVDVGHGRGG